MMPKAIWCKYSFVIEMTYKEISENDYGLSFYYLYTENKNQN